MIQIPAATAIENDEQQCNWVERLSDTGTQRDSAIEELRRYLVGGLSRSMGYRYGGVLQVEDAVQEALLKIINKLDTFEGRSKFTTWAMTITNRVAISRMRRKHFSDLSLDKLQTEHNVQVEVKVPNSQRASIAFDRMLVLRKLNELIQTELSEKQRSAMQALLDGISIEEIAEQTGSNRNAVYKLIHDAKAKLRQGFDRSGIDAAIMASIFC